LVQTDPRLTNRCERFALKRLALARRRTIKRYTEFAMDAARLLMTFTILLIGIGVSRFVVTTMGRAGDVMATLFVPPDRALGWPRGVQESDEPWGWRRPPGGGPAPPVDRGGDDDDRGSGEPRAWTEPQHGSFVVPVDRVAPVHLGVRPH
jgi:hypothetical protein